jgi:hypothetical protein
MPQALQAYCEQKDWEAYKIEIINLKKAHKQESDEDAVVFARSFCYRTALYLWKSVDHKNKWKCRQAAFPVAELDLNALRLAKEIGDYFLASNIMEYAYLFGSLYTMLLPDSYRSDNGIYYTPPALAERLLDLLAAEGADWAEADIVDPACGGGAFLITVANRMLGDYRIKELSAEEKLAHLEEHLEGFEIDRFAGWLTQVLLDIIVYHESITAGRRLKDVVKFQDTIRAALHEEKKYDIIVGNPPYGRVKLDEDIRKSYERSLYGHANLYGLFIDASLRLKKPDGLVGFVTPTSFLGGKYFSNLRALLSQAAPPLAIDFVSVRTGIFDQVLQETCLVTFGRNKSKSVITNKICIENSTYKIERIGSFNITNGTMPWVIAREPAEAGLASKMKKIQTTLSDYGYKVSTGQLVWNRLKDKISESHSDGAKPIIWAEAISADGRFVFDYQYRKKLKYISVSDKQNFLICNQPVVLVQRTTAKEQNKRLQACVLPQSFVEQWNGVVVENHVNIIQPTSDCPKISLKALTFILNSQTVDRVFRCLSGSVAVSAAELHALPLPSVKEVYEIEELIAVNDGKKPENIAELIEQIIKNAYGLGGLN